MSGWDIAGIIIAVFWAVLVCFLAYTLVHVARVLKEAKTLVASLTEETVPLLNEMTSTVTHTNAQLGRVDTITSNLASISDNATALTSLFTNTVGQPLVKMAAFGHGLRKAAKARSRANVEKRVRETMKAERAARRSAR